MQPDQELNNSRTSKTLKESHAPRVLIDINISKLVDICCFLDCLYVCVVSAPNSEKKTIPTDRL